MQDMAIHAVLLLIDIFLCLDPEKRLVEQLTELKFTTVKSMTGWSFQKLTRVDIITRAATLMTNSFSFLEVSKIKTKNIQPRLKDFKYL